MQRINTSTIRHWTILVIILATVLASPHQGRCEDARQSLPSFIYGSWVIKSVYPTRNVTGLGKADEKRLLGSHLTFTRTSLASCGSSVSINALERKHVTEVEFFSGVYVHFKEVHIVTEAVEEILLDAGEAGDCNGTGTLPGEHFYIKTPGEILIQYEGTFFRALKLRENDRSIGPSTTTPRPKS